MATDEYTAFFDESEHPLAEFYRERVEQNRDLVILITDGSNDRGTGKTTLALQLAAGMDRTDEGISMDQVAVDPRPLSQQYTNQPKGSSLVLDESESGMDKYNASSTVNRAIRELVSMGRIEEKYLCLNAPGDHLVDKDLKTLVDVWILIERRGYAKVYRMDYQPHAGHELTRGMGTLSWDPIPQADSLHSVFEELTSEKRLRLRGDDNGDEYVLKSEAEEWVTEAKEKAKTEFRDELIERMNEDPKLTQAQIAELVGLSRSRVSQLCN
jgi:hypothetical protein